MNRRMPASGAYPVPGRFVVRWSTADREVTKASQKKLKMKVLTIGGREIELLTIEDAAKSLGFASETIRREVWRKKLGSLNMSGRIFIRRDQLEQYVAQCTRPAETEETR
jgi:excisionase family DNA binding protein